MYLPSGYAIFTRAKILGSAVIFPSHRGSASKNVWESLLCLLRYSVLFIYSTYPASLTSYDKPFLFLFFFFCYKPFSINVVHILSTLVSEAHFSLLYFLFINPILHPYFVIQSDSIHSISGEISHFCESVSNEIK